ncbi:hypothetical protein AABB24_008023 [Solanum stoloniferum]|uniref:Uncharacterized protein n=1 Tax=Solanum stoloniferum TaxID=62892 RepID=A0ABD2UUS7_9SOLN
MLERPRNDRNAGLLFCQHPPLSDQATNLFLFKEVMQLCLTSLPSMSTSDTQIYDVLVDMESGDKIVNIDTNNCEPLRQRKGLPQISWRKYRKTSIGHARYMS